MNADRQNVLPPDPDRKIIDPTQVLAEWRVAGRGQVAKVIGWVAWQPVPTRWMQECAGLGRWPARLAGLLLQLNGRRWTWRWRDSPTALWRDVLRVKWPGAIGRDTFLRAWRALVAADLVAWTDDAWRCNTDGMAENAKRCAQIPESRPLKVWRTKVTRAHACEREGVLSSISVGSTVKPHTDPATRPSLEPTEPDPACARPRALQVEGQLRGTGMRLPGGSVAGADRRERIAEAVVEPMPVAQGEDAFGKRVGLLRRALLKRWGMQGIYRFELQSAMLHELRTASETALDSEWSSAVELMLKRDDPPSVVAKYLAKLVQVAVAKREPQLRIREETDVLGTRLAESIKKCNAPTANDATRQTEGPTQGVHPAARRETAARGRAPTGRGSRDGEASREGPRGGGGREASSGSARGGDPRRDRDGDRLRESDRDEAQRAESQLGEPGGRSAHVAAVPGQRRR